ncbi:MAG: hypothetical protein IPJ41_03945 [Phycisphaerales bacterium]|nr:hypothetical protein [Phycisphaerales bacterium]
MPAAAPSISALQILGLCAAAALLLAGLWVLWRSRHRRTEDERVPMPLLGWVGVPTGLTIGVCLLGAGYHAMAYSLLPQVNLVAIPIQRWWIVAAVIVVAITGSIGAERLEARHSGDPGG